MSETRKDDTYSDDQRTNVLASPRSSVRCKAYKFRLYPTARQIKTLQWTLDRCRELYNAALQERHDAYEMCVRHHPNYYNEELRKQLTYEHAVGYYEQKRDLPEIRQEIRPEYQAIHSQVLQDVLDRLNKAFKAFFRRVKNGETPGYPRFQGKGRYDSFTYTQAGFSIKQGKLELSKIGHIKIKMHRPIVGTIKTCTIKRERLHWYVCFSCEVEMQEHDQQRTPYTDEAVGIDLGLYHFAALSTGDLIDNPRYYRRAEQQLIAAQQTFSRRKRGSQRWKKAGARLARQYRKIRHRRHNFLHQWSRRLVNTYQTIVFEELEPKNMSKKPEPKQGEETGKYLPNGASRKAGLNKSIMDAGWSTFVSLCQYKAVCAGTVQVIKVDPYKTSQVCSGCLKEGPHKDLSERTHTCEHCGLVLDRDTNAAVTILAVWQNGLNLREITKKARPKPKKKAKARSKKSKVAWTEPSVSDRAAN